MRIMLCLGLIAGGVASAAETATASPPGLEVFARENLVAWCIVPFDARQRGPEARAEMMARLGFKHFAYDWRDEHIPTFDEEIETLKRWGIGLSAFWFPSALNEQAQAILEVLKRHEVRTELWVTMGGGEIEASPEEHQRRVEEHVAVLKPLAEAAAEIGCKLGLYNHGGWFGEPRNQIAILKALDMDNVGLVYNLHHGHHQLDEFPQLLEAMKPYLLCLNLNGMEPKGDEIGKKIWPLGSGSLDLELLRVIAESGYTGPIGILGHTMDDAEETLHDNLDGLDWLVERLRGNEPGPRPALRVGRDAAASVYVPDAFKVEDPARRAALPEYQMIPAAPSASLTPAQAVAADTYQRWERSHGGDHNARYSAATQINRENVNRLRPAWTYRSGDPGNVQCNPIVVDGVLYAPAAAEYLVAVDAATGKERWRFRPGAKPAFRGLSYWPGRDALPPRLLFHAGESLWALDPATGAPLASFGDGGRVDTGEARVAPAVYEDLVLTALYEKDVAAYDLHTGVPRWRFHTIPGDGEYGADTWDAPEEGANCWGGTALDAGRGIFYVSTGSPKPNFTGNTHRGQNLFANCVIALDARTGARLWHFQELRHDIWDIDIPAPPNLLSITRDGRRVDVVAQVTKLGNTLVLDRVSGAPIYPFRLRRAPVSTLPGERTWPYQPDVELPEPFARQVFSLDDVTVRSREAREHVLAQLGQANYGWMEAFAQDVPTALYNIHGGAEWMGAAVDPESGRLYVTSNNVPWIVTVFRPDEVRREPGAPPTRGEEVYQANCVQCHGPDRRGVGVNPPLQGLGRRLDDAAVLELLATGKGLMPSLEGTVTQEDQQALLDYLFLRDVPPEAVGEAVQDGRPRYTHNGYPKLLDHEGYPGVKPPWGTLNCLDLNTGKLVWQAPLGNYPDLADWGEDDTGAENFGGASVTAGGLVFCAGTPDSMIRAFDAETGEVLWQHALPYVGSAPPTIYEVGGQQFVVVPATGGGKLGTAEGDAYVAFALPGG